MKSNRKRFLGILMIMLVTMLFCFTGCTEAELDKTLDSLDQILTESDSAADSTPDSGSETDSGIVLGDEGYTTGEYETDIDTVDDADAYVQYTFRYDSYLTEHFEKHGEEFGEEFGYVTAEDYLEGANAVIVNPNALHKTEKEDGDDIYYLEETNEFVIVSTDGYLRTYFRPSAGKKYYDRQ